MLKCFILRTFHTELFHVFAPKLKFAFAGKNCSVIINLFLPKPKAGIKQFYEHSIIAYVPLKAKSLPIHGLYNKFKVYTKSFKVHIVRNFLVSSDLVI